MAKTIEEAYRAILDFARDMAAAGHPVEYVMVTNACLNNALGGIEEAEARGFYVRIAERTGYEELQLPDIF
jgi:hypothetical protein